MRNMDVSMFHIEISILIVVLLASNFAMAENSIRVSVNAVGKPYHYIDRRGVTEGLLVDIFKVVLEEMDQEAEFSSNSYTRGVTLMNHGDIDLLTVATIPNEPIELPNKAFVTPEPISKVPMVIYALVDSNIEIKNWDQIKQYKFGILRYNHRPTGDEKDKFIYPRNEYLLKALADGDIDIALTAPGFSDYWGDRFGVRFEAVLPVTVMNSYLAVSTQRLGADAKEICSQYFLAYQRLTLNGGLEKVFDRHKLDKLKSFFILKPGSLPVKKACIPIESLSAGGAI